MEFTQEQLKEMEELDDFYAKEKEMEELEEFYEKVKENEGDEQTTEMAEKNEGHRALYNLWAPGAPWNFILYAALDRETPGSKKDSLL